MMTKPTDSALTASRLNESAKMTSHRQWVHVVDNFFQSRWKGLSVAIPYVWLVIFFLVPFFIVLKISFAESLIASPPFSSLFEWSEDAALKMTLIFDNFAYLWEDDLYVKTYLNSVKISTISTILCLLIGYPMAYAIVRASGTMKYLLLLMVILPFWTSFLLRVYAWMGILADQGTLNSFLIWAGIIDQPIRMMYSEFAVYTVSYTHLTLPTKRIV